MKPGTKVNKKNLPKNLGRPIVLISDGFSFCYTRIRIVYPNGKVEYVLENMNHPGYINRFYKGCTSRNSFHEAILAIIGYQSFADDGSRDIFFGGYL